MCAFFERFNQKYLAIWVPSSLEKNVSKIKISGMPLGQSGTTECCYFRCRARSTFHLITLGTPSNLQGGRITPKISSKPPIFPDGLFLRPLFLSDLITWLGSKWRTVFDSVLGEVIGRSVLTVYWSTMTCQLRAHSLGVHFGLESIWTTTHVGFGLVAKLAPNLFYIIRGQSSNPKTPRVLTDTRGDKLWKFSPIVKGISTEAAQSEFTLFLTKRGVSQNKM